MILDLFDFTELLSIVVVYQRPSDFNIVDTALHMLSKLPDKSVFVIFEHGKSRFSLDNLDAARKYSGFSPRAVYHLNHEKPWLSKVSEYAHENNFLDKAYENVERLIEFYSQYDLVLRNYYYKPLLNFSFYLPVGPTLFGYMVGNRSSPINQAAGQPSSRRSIFCKFKGRVKYEVLVHSDEKDEGVVEPYGIEVGIPIF